MKFILITILTFATCLANAQNVKRLSQDVKLPTQGVVEQQTFLNLQVASATYVVSGAAGNTSAAAAVLSTFTLQPDSPRNIVITPVATTGDLEACVIVVAGTDILNHSISENFTFSANDTAAQTGAKAFKTVSSVTFPADCESGAFGVLWRIGIGEKIGLKRCIAEEGAFLQSSLNGTLEATRATVVAGASAVSGNTADFNGTMNGSNDFKAYFIQNFACY